jgi:hypothetical protein
MVGEVLVHAGEVPRAFDLQRVHCSGYSSAKQAFELGKESLLGLANRLGRDIGPIASLH